ncbi:MAG: family peptidase [Burkholderiales bacterium]|jgi:predicted metalloendopeptidase|nr:family peptidase [Burkholderiales bacterium]
MRSLFRWLAIISLSVLAVTIQGCNDSSSTSAAASPAANISGIDLGNMDLLVHPGDDFYSFVNGTWLKNTPIPSDKVSLGAGVEVYENSINQLHDIISELTRHTNLPDNSDEQKIVFLFNSYMNSAKLDQLGIKPLLPELTKIDEITDINQIPGLIAHFNHLGISAPYSALIDVDTKDSTKIAVYVQQNGLGLPDRDYYLNTTDRNLVDIKTKYQQYIQDILTMVATDIPHTNPSQDAIDIVKLETELAEIQWSNVDNRDITKIYNKMSIKEINQLMPDYDWNQYLLKASLNDKITNLIVNQPSYLQGLDQIIKQTPLSVWKVYFKWKMINNFAPMLSENYVDKNFAFYGTVLSGTTENIPRWRRALNFVETNIGYALGKLYVKQYFPEQNKIMVEDLVNNLKIAFDQSIDELDWMGADTKKEAKKKLVTMVLKIGYPDKWRDYSNLVVKPDDLIDNAIATAEFEYNRNLNKLGKPVDKTEWQMTPQTVNAYYNPTANEIVFPAAILQPPFFNVNAALAVNYGAIGAIIGHEISHAFDDQGSQFDENGNLHNWWTAEDSKRFKEKTARLVQQYNAYSPLPGYYVNGELTLGENIADNSGLEVALKAYHLAVKDNKNQIALNIFTGDQVFYISFAQTWRYKARDQQIISSLKTNPHSPAQFRCNGTLGNQDEFYQAFHVKPGDKLYIPPAQRVNLW